MQGDAFVSTVLEGVRSPTRLGKYCKEVPAYMTKMKTLEIDWMCHSEV